MPSLDDLHRHAARSQAGFGLIELLIALTVLAIGIAAAIAVFAGSIITLQHSRVEGTAITLADRQLEAYRAMPFGCIPIPIPPSMARPGACTIGPTYSGFPDPYAASQSVSGSDAPDHRAYTVTTSVSSAAGSATQLTVTVALTSNPGKTLAQETSYFSDSGTAPTS